jgi:methylmalonyl-CoA epimerase
LHTIVTWLDHIAIAVQDSTPLLHVLSRLLDLEPYRREPVESQAVETIFLPTGRTKLELVHPLHADSPISGFLKKRGDAMHHLAFEVEDVRAVMERARALGLRPLSEEPQPGADGKLIFFVHPRDTHGILLEFCQQARIDLEVERVEVDGASMSVYQGGRSSAEPVFLLHGEPGGLQVDFAHLVPVLERRFRVIAPERALVCDGMAAREGTLSVDALLSLMDVLNVDRTRVFGYSAGGAAALELAVRAPERVAGVALFGVSPSTAADESAEPAPPGDSWSDVVRYSEAAIHREARAVISRLPLEQLENPVLVCCGDRDPVCSVRHALTLHERLPSSQLSVFAGADHDLQSVPPERLLDVLDDWARASEGNS